jgi:type IV pilus assembly protein PilB
VDHVPTNLMLNKADQFQLKAELLQRVSAEQAWHYRILPVNHKDSCLEIWTDNSEANLQDELELVLGETVCIKKVDTGLIQQLLARFYRKSELEVTSVSLQADSDDFVYDLIKEAKNVKSSDIHIEIYEGRCRVRIRVDGLMVERFVISKEQYPAIVNKIKIMGNLDIAEKRLPQDGRIFYNYKQNKFDIRVSVLPTLHGEKIVMRLLSNDATDIDLNTLGFSETDLANYLEGVKRPTGMLLISGPTGSGKTTTLYATLKLLNQQTRNILTIEDPIEYTLEGVNQVQLKEAIGLTFGSALRTFLRQDPDIIMVGEIRDPETASMAVRAALTGHLVLSTIHTNSAWGAVSRLVDMGIPPFLVASTLNTTVAQRLVRLLCPNCKEQAEFDEKLYPRQFKPFRKITKHALAKGCENCFYTGYKGRKAVYEVIPIDYDLVGKIKETKFDVADEMNDKGFKSLAFNAFELFENESTTLDEIYPLLFNF